MAVSPRAVFAGIAALSALALAAALVSQHGFGMQPCPWCVLQRLIFVLIFIAAALGAWGAWVAPGTAAIGRQKATVAAGVVTSLLATAGMAAALWQHFVAASQASCDLTLADRIMSATSLDMAWPEVFGAFASCADAKVYLFGVPYEFFSLALFVVFEAAAVWAMLKMLRR